MNIRKLLKSVVDEIKDEVMTKVIDNFDYSNMAEEIKSYIIGSIDLNEIAKNVASSIEDDVTEKIKSAIDNELDFSDLEEEIAEEFDVRENMDDIIDNIESYL